jgi:hypothetical protein
MSLRPKESWHCSLTRVTLLSERDAADRASSRLMPFVRCSSIWWSRWNRNSASRSRSTRRRPKADRKRHFTVLAQRIVTFYVMPTTRLIALDKRSQFARSSSSRFWPARVSE